MNGLSVVIPSKTVENLKASVAAVHLHEPSAHVIIVDDFEGQGLDRATAESIGLDLWKDTVLTGIDPFVFARNCNLGIQAVGQDDVVLLNDDAILKTHIGFSLLQRVAADDPTIGLVSASTNVAGNPEQLRRKPPGGAVPVARIIGNCPGNSFPTLAYVCVLIPRRTIDVVGLLDERFTAYGWEDNDYSRRLHLAGLKIAVHDGCFVDHASLKPTFRAQPTIGADLQDGRQIYMAKWGSI